MERHFVRGHFPDAGGHMAFFGTFCHPVLKTGFFAHMGQRGDVFIFKFLVRVGSREGGEGKAETMVNHEIHELHKKPET